MHKINEMKRLTLLTFLLTSIVLILVSCGTGKQQKLLGTWKVTDVQTDFDETKVTPEMLKQVAEMQKQTYFRILNDTTLVIISNNNTHEAKWAFDDKTQTITYLFKGTGSKANVLGTFTDGNIVNQTKTALGKMTITYGKE
jgi:hypothetical protein